MRSSFEIIDFFRVEPIFSRNMRILRKISDDYGKIYVSKPYEFDSLAANL